MNLTIFFNGRYVKVTQAAFEQLLPGELSGRGAFETMRMYDGKIFAFEDHLKRLKGGLRHFAIGLPLSGRRIEEVVGRLSGMNKLKNSRVRVIIWTEGGRKNTTISLQPLSLPSPATYRRGYRVMTAALDRRPTRHSHVKSIAYQLLRRISKDAQLRGFDEAVLLNRQGEIVEGTRTNLFFVKNNVVHTPALRCGALNGITRRKVIECARAFHFPVRFVRARLSDLFKADEVFLTGSTLEIMRIASINGRKMKGKPSVVPLLQQAYREMVKREVSDCPSQKRLV